MTFLEIYLVAGFAILVLNTGLWLVSLALKDASIIDPMWSVLFMLAGGIYFCRMQAGEFQQTIRMLFLK